MQPASLILVCIVRHDSTQKSAQKVRSSYYAFLFSPDQDQIVVDDIIFRMFRFNLHATDYAPQFWIDRRRIEERIAQKMVCVQHK